MFYLQTKDGERFFTSKYSDDKAEFERILRDKLGNDAAEMFDDFVEVARMDGEESVSFDGYVETDYVVDVASDLGDVIKQLNILLNEPEISKSDIQVNLDELQELYSKLISI
jgi:hypothetical protein